MILKDYNSILITNFLKFHIRFEYGFLIEFGNKVNICEFVIMVNKNNGSNIPCHHGVFFVSWYKARIWDHKLIDSDNLTTFFKGLILD